jgi:hypothetical protein
VIRSIGHDLRWPACTAVVPVASASHSG